MESEPKLSLSDMNGILDEILKHNILYNFRASIILAKNHPFYDWYEQNYCSWEETDEGLIFVPPADFNELEFAKAYAIYQRYEKSGIEPLNLNKDI